MDKDDRKEEEKGLAWLGETIWNQVLSFLSSSETPQPAATVERAAPTAEQPAEISDPQPSTSRGPTTSPKRHRESTPDLEVLETLLMPPLKRARIVELPDDEPEKKIDDAKMEPGNSEDSEPPAKRAKIAETPAHEEESKPEESDPSSDSEPTKKE